MTHGKRRNVGASVRARLMNRSRETSKVKPIRAHEEDVGFRALFWANISEHTKRTSAFVRSSGPTFPVREYGCRLISALGMPSNRHCSTRITQPCSTLLVRKSAFIRAKLSWLRSSTRWLYSANRTAATRIFTIFTRLHSTLVSMASPSCVPSAQLSKDAVPQFSRICQSL